MYFSSYILYPPPPFPIGILGYNLLTLVSFLTNLYFSFLMLLHCLQGNLEFGVRNSANLEFGVRNSANLEFGVRNLEFRGKNALRGISRGESTNLELGMRNLEFRGKNALQVISRWDEKVRNSSCQIPHSTFII
jgi:hypothetical protein